MNPSLDRRGLWFAVGAYVAWGVMPLYWHLLKAVPSFQIILHRILWSTLFVALWLGWRYGRGWIKETLRIPRARWMLALSGVLVAFNWGLYIWAVNAGHVVESSLGYFINPLFNVVLGVLVLHERLRRLQWIAVAVAGIGVLWLTFDYGRFPWIAIALAASFGGYGLIRKLVDAPAVRGLGIEGLYLVMPAIVWMLWSETHGEGGFVAHGTAPAWGLTANALLIFGGILTALPLIGFAEAVRRIPYTIVGVLQYISPTLQLACGVLILGEDFERGRAIGFGFIWLALLLFVAEGMLHARHGAAARTTGVDGNAATRPAPPAPAASHAPGADRRGRPVPDSPPGSAP